MKLFLLVLLVAVTAALAQPVDSRYCGMPARDPDGSIRRSALVINDFKRIHPCPATGKSDECPGWSIDHVIPLACGGCDSIHNMQWLPTGYKVNGKDRWERKIYGKGIGTNACSNEIVVIPPKIK